ncbi:MAG: hypothetical protein HY560_03430 [Gemmatimonadetes bacterium]|nr:hypothetical protein [Gemmatimonadota bacterium]
MAVVFGALAVAAFLDTGSLFYSAAFTAFALMMGAWLLGSYFIERHE